MDSAGQQVTLAWLASAFELHDGASLARRDVYKDYVEFCQRVGLNPTTAAIFGKLVRVVFPTISSRRLGRRGANVVHYYNFRKKPSSPSSASPSTAPSSLSHATGATVTTTPGLSSMAAAASPGTTDLDPSPTAPPTPHASSPTVRGTSTAVARSSASATGTPSTSLAPIHQGLSLPGQQSPGAVGGGGRVTLVQQLVASPGKAMPSALAVSPAPSTVIPSAPTNSEPFAVPFPPVPAAFSFTALPFPVFHDDQKMDDPYTLASSAQSRINAPPVRQDQLCASALWSAVQHGELYAMALASHFMHHYRHSYYVQCPLHPAALEENNVRYILCTKDGAEERSALSLNVYYALCLGALISGHIATAREFFQITKDHLSDVFDMTDYSVAQVLVPMGFSERFFARDEAEGWRVSVYYLTLANQICRRLGALASDVYSRCSKAVFFMEDVDLEQNPATSESSNEAPTSKQEVSWEEIIQTELNFHQQIQQQKQRWLSYTKPRRAHKTLYAILFAIVDLMDAMNNLEKLRQTRLAKRQQQQQLPSAADQTEHEEEREFTRGKEDGRMLARLLGLLAPDAAKRLEGVTESNAQADRGLERSGGAPPRPSSTSSAVEMIEERGLGTRDVSRIAQYFTDQLLLLEEELLVLYQGTEVGEQYLSVQSYQMTRIFIYGLRVENRWIAGDQSATLALIMDFLELHRRERHNLMLFETKSVFQRILDILYEMGRRDIMRQMIHNLGPLARVASIFNTMCEHYSKLANE